MSEPILSREELQHAARAILMAVLGGPHDIERASVTVHFDDAKPGHNALNQMSRRIEIELAALLEKLRGEPVAWRDPSNMDAAQSVTFDARDASKWPHIYSQPLYNLKGQSRRSPMTC
ncbi:MULTISPECIES: hypothetical protein [Burkholderia]|uniref:hypothetical protein n=1 Tax=Burkholderia TaxID=32008 RepID=UPI0012BB7C4A|nr:MULTISPECIES: hypothetical protein [Burkholderia]